MMPQWAYLEDGKEPSEEAENRYPRGLSKRDRARS